MPATDDYVVDFPSLWVVPAWIERHIPIPDGFHKGRAYVLADWQLWCTVNHYRVRPDAEWVPEKPVLAPAFHHRRSQIVGPQKSGKGPWSAAIVCNEAQGPALFAGWAGKDDGFVCAEHGCTCGWEYPYRPGEPMGMLWPTPLIQLLATSEDQVDNVYRPLKNMIRGGPLADRMLIREDFIRLPNDGEIAVVTSSALSRLGNPITFALQDETGLYTKANKLDKVADTQRRGLAGMGGRSIETTNCWDPSEQSTAQQTAEGTADDVFRFHRLPPANLSYRNKRERRLIHRHVYDGSWWVDLDAIEAEAAELNEKDPGQAERFFGNRVVHGAGAWIPEELWERSRPEERRGLVIDVCGGFDGSDSNDWTAIRLERLDGFQFTPTYGPDRRPTIWDPATWPAHKIPRGEVQAAVFEVFTTFRVERFYCDPRDWQSEIESWALQWGAEHVIEWDTGRGSTRIPAVHAALERFVTDLTTGALTHDDCPTTALHIANARKVAKPGDRYILGKPNDHQKIDAAMASVICHEAAADARAAGWGMPAARTTLTRARGRTATG